jgi:LemA protein
MKKVLLGCGLVVVVVAVFLVMAVMGSYNRLVTLEEAVKTAWSQVENVYQRRADLVPNLVETVKGAAAFEKDTFTAVTEARAKVGQMTLGKLPNAAEMQQFQTAQDGLSSALSRLLVVVEKYPELKAAQAFNTLRRRFPTVIVASLFGFAEKPYFQAAPGSDKAPQVKF